eukprot:221700-Chlamydomonas_euryale.AAC.1
MHATPAPLSSASSGGRAADPRTSACAAPAVCVRVWGGEAAEVNEHPHLWCVGGEGRVKGCRKEAERLSRVGDYRVGKIWLSGAGAGSRGE